MVFCAGLQWNVISCKPYTTHSVCYEVLCIVTRSLTFLNMCILLSQALLIMLMLVTYIKTLNVSLDYERNTAGRWITKVVIEHSKTEPNLWNVFIIQDIVKHESAQNSMRINAILGKVQVQKEGSLNPDSRRAAVDDTNGWNKVPDVGCIKHFNIALKYDDADTYCRNIKASLNLLYNQIQIPLLEEMISKEGKITDDVYCEDYFYLAGRKNYEPPDFTAVYALRRLGTVQILKNKKMQSLRKKETQPPDLRRNLVRLQEIENAITRWAPGQPDDPQMEGCFAYYKEYGLHDIPCDWEQTFFCYKPKC